VGVPIAVVVSSLAFAAFHTFNPAFGPLPLINLVLFGLATALYKLRLDGNQLWGVSCHPHRLELAAAGGVRSAEQRARPAPENALFTVTPPIDLPAPLSGGGFGPEGTLAASLVLLALIVAGLRAKRRLWLRVKFFGPNRTAQGAQTTGRQSRAGRTPASREDRTSTGARPPR
jgi:hypothetical protein